MHTWRSGNAVVCKTIMRQFDSDRVLHIAFGLIAQLVAHAVEQATVTRFDRMQVPAS